MILGDFIFDIKSIAPNTLSRTTNYNWSDSERIGGLPNLQNLGLNSDQIELEGVFYPKFNRYLKCLNDLRNSNLVKNTNNLITDKGEILGKFAIISIKENQSYFDKNGEPQKVEFSMSLKRANSQVSTNTVESMTNLSRSYLKW